MAIENKAVVERAYASFSEALQRMSPNMTPDKSAALANYLHNHQEAIASLHLMLGLVLDPKQFTHNDILTIRREIISAAQKLDIELTDKDKNSAAHWSAYMGNHEDIKAQAALGLNINTPNRLGTIPAFDALRGKHFDLFDYYVDTFGKKEILTHSNRYNFDALNWSVYHANLPAVEHICKIISESEQITKSGFAQKLRPTPNALDTALWKMRFSQANILEAFAVSENPDIKDAQFDRKTQNIDAVNASRKIYAVLKEKGMKHSPKYQKWISANNRTTNEIPPPMFEREALTEFVPRIIAERAMQPASRELF